MISCGDTTIPSPFKPTSGIPSQLHAALLSSALIITAENGFWSLGWPLELSLELCEERACWRIWHRFDEPGRHWGYAVVHPVLSPWKRHNRILMLSYHYMELRDVIWPCFDAWRVQIIGIPVPMPRQFPPKSVWHYFTTILAELEWVFFIFIYIITINNTIDKIFELIIAWNFCFDARI